MITLYTPYKVGSQCFIMRRQEQRQRNLQQNEAILSF
jgi:hypothetical protein